MPKNLDRFDGIEIQILGTTYIFKNEDSNGIKAFEDADGLVDPTSKTIYLNQDLFFNSYENDLSNYDNPEKHVNRVVRHEIIHCFFFESGLWGSSSDVSNWATSEELTDWIALQFPKIYKIYKDLGVLN
jgi:hypothetical protein